MLADLLVVLVLVAGGGQLLWWRAAMLDRIGVAGWLLFGLECVMVGWMVLTALLLVGRTSPRVSPPLADPDTTLDIFIPVAGEPEALVAATIEAAKSVRWLNVRILVCNDGWMAGRDNWQDIERLCARMGVDCITRTTGAKGKAGNLNHALATSTADAILVIDADHRVIAEVPQQLLGWLRHENVAFVGTPQEFVDSSSDSLNPTEPMFYRGVQPARDRLGLAFSTGNGALYRRRAVVEIGGFSEWSVVEDLHTSIRLHAAGWRSVFHPRPVSIGLAPQTSAEYAKQRLRWAVDSLRILRHDPPFRRRGLSLWGRIHYTHTLVSYLVTMLQVGFLLGPPAWIIARLPLLADADWRDQGLHIGLWLAALVAALVYWAGFRGAIRSIRLTTAFLPVVFTTAAWRTLTARSAHSAVTAKVNLPRMNRLVLLGLSLPLLLIATMVWGVFDPRPGGSDLAMGWAALLAIVAAGPLLRFGYSRVWPVVYQVLLSGLAVTLLAGSVAVVRFGWEAPGPLYRSFEPALAATGAVVETNELGDPVVVGPAVMADTDPVEVAADGSVADSTTADGAAAPVRLSLQPADGIYVGFTSRPLPYDLSDVERWADDITEPQIVHWYQQWGSGDSRFRGDWIAEIHESGRVPMISWEAWAKPEGGFSLPEQELGNMAEIAAGDHDDYIDSWAEAAAETGRPILIRPFHEMNGTWYPWSVDVNGNTPETFVAGWRHVVDRFRAAGADNVSFVWSINTFASFDEGRDVMEAYPGDDYVDWVATSGFNWDDYQPEWSSWVTAEWVFADTYEFLASLGKPVMFSEIGTATNTGDGVAWISEAMAWSAELPELKAIVWFDQPYVGGIDFRLDPDQADALAAAVEDDPRFAPELAVGVHRRTGTG